MKRTQHALISLFAFVTISVHAGESSTEALAFKQYYETNLWYFAELTALPTNLPGFVLNAASNTRQAFLKTPNGSQLIYSEYKMINIKVIEMKGNFTQVDATAGIFRCEDNYTRLDTNNILLTAAFDSRLLLVEGRNYERGTDQALVDATTLARLVLENTKKKQNIEPGSCGYVAPRRADAPHR
jgi:hypothetical protein